MSPEAQRKAIAEACNWKPSVDAGICWDRDGNPIVSYPDFLNDLNAMHEAEKVLSSENQDEYAYILGSLTTTANGVFPYIHATAAQRAEAFLRTLGKWTDA